MTDLISRQAALEMLNDNELERQADDVFDGDLHRYKRAAQRIIAQLPTIEPKRGKWINDGNPYALYKCSVCNNFCPAVGYAECIPEERMYKIMKYCPTCGAQMKEERSEE